MKTGIFLATGGNGIQRAFHSNGEWSIDEPLTGEDVRCLAVDPLNRSVVYAGTQGNGVFRSIDHGRTWRTAGLRGHIVKSIAVSGLQPNVLYAGTKPALIFVSQDAGSTWRELSNFRKIESRRLWFSPAEPPFTAYVQGIALSPTDPNLILAGIEFGAVVRSTDGGKTWSSHRRGALRDCHTITFHARDGDWVYEAGGSGAGAAVSRDAGETWSQPDDGLDRHYGWACAADPERPDLWYVSVSPGPRKAHRPGSAEAYIFRSTAGGAWTKLTGGLPEPLDHMPYALLTDPEHPGHIFAGLSNGELWHSEDYGDSWHRSPLHLAGIHRELIML